MPDNANPLPFRGGDEPDRPYDVAPTPRRSPALPVLPPPIVHAQPHRDPTALLGRLMFLAPALVLATEVALISAAAALTATPHRALAAAIGFTLLTLAVRIPIAVGAGLLLAHACDVSLGRVAPGVVRLCAIGLAPPAVGATLLLAVALAGHAPSRGLLDPFADGLGGAVVACAASLLVYFALCTIFFDLPNDPQSWRFVLILWASQVFIAGLGVHLLVSPPPKTPPYVPDRERPRFLIGN